MGKEALHSLSVFFILFPGDHFVNFFRPNDTLKKAGAFVLDFLASFILKSQATHRVRYIARGGSVIPAKLD